MSHGLPRGLLLLCVLVLGAGCLKAMFLPFTKIGWRA